MLGEELRVADLHLVLETHEQEIGQRVNRGGCAPKTVSRATYLLVRREPGEIPPSEAHLAEETHDDVLLERAREAERLERVRDRRLLAGARREVGLLLELHLIRLRRLRPGLGDHNLRRMIRR